jgi:NDP-sugar pyrophosphorylase family protein
MKVVFLCGGIGKRMFPMTEDKFLIKFVGKTLLQHQIERARQAGLKEFVVIGNPQNIERVEQVTRSISGVGVEFAVQEKPLGIANALESAEHLLGEAIILVNPNDVFESSAYTRLTADYKKNGAHAYVIIIGYAINEYFPGGYLVVDAENHLQHILEKPERGKEPSQLINILVHLHTDCKKVLEYAKKVGTTRDDVYECALNSMLVDQHRIRVIAYRDFWQAIKYPWHILGVVRHFLDVGAPGISPTACISEKATIEGKVIICDNVRVLENAVVRGPVYIGPNSVIGNNALVRDYSHIGADCIVGYGTEVKSSYIGYGCWFHSSYIGDSIISDGCSFAAGTVLANLRFDERNIKVKVEDHVIDTGLGKLGAMIGSNCKTGINASVMPGTRIGPGSIVGPHVCLMNDLEPGKMVLAESPYRTLPAKITPDGEKKERFLKSI